MRQDPWKFYDWLVETANQRDAYNPGDCDRMTLGRVWTVCESGSASGLCMSPEAFSRTLSFPGLVAGSPIAEMTYGVCSWNPFEAAVGMAAINVTLPFDPTRFDDVKRLPNEQGNLAVFDYFLPKIKGARIVVVGRYPGLERYEKEYDLKVIERSPGESDYPDTAAEYLIPDADWLFLTASSIANKTFPRLAELGRDCSTVLMGPSTPWLPELADWGIDFLAGVSVNDRKLLTRIASEGGGRRIFEKAVSYFVADIGTNHMQAVQQQISMLAGQRDHLKELMDEWYDSHRQRFPDLAALEEIQDELSLLDTRYKQMWDIRQIEKAIGE